VSSSRRATTRSWVEGNHYFAADALQRQYVRAEDHNEHLPLKGEASYYSLRVGDA